jgi:aspartyl-tRNA synthetase
MTGLGVEQQYYNIVMSGHEIKSGQLFIYDPVVVKILCSDVHPET